ncbi:Ig-like domain-containing protein [Mycobacterium sp. NPDC051804]|uniref:Ig-like domain-containing protein n=1 Tax=Mycobacterium sp. NPDC051804 TaxID=3364295 RepID=UPI0037B03E56
MRTATSLHHALRGRHLAAVSRHFSCATYIGRVGALAVALGIGSAVAFAPGVAWAEGTGEDTASVDSGPANPQPVNEAEDGGNEGDSNPGNPGGVTPAPTTTTTGSQSTTVIGGGGSPQVTISGSTVDLSGTTTEQTPASSAPTTAKATPTATVEPTTPPQPSYTPEPPPSTVPEPISSTVPEPDPPATAPEGGAQELNAGVGDSQNFVDGQGDPSGTTMITAFDGGADPGAGQFGLRMSGPTGVDEPQNLMAADFSAGLTTLDEPAPPPPAPDPFEAISVFVGSIISQVVNAVSAALAPVFGPGAPLYNSVIWGAIEAVRRQTNQAWANSTPVVDLQTTGQQDLDDREIHGTLNGSDPDDDALTYSVPTSGVGAPTNGTVTIDAAAGTWTYKPNEGYTGSDSFTITASDELAGYHIHGAGQAHTASDSITVTVSAVTPTNNPPVAGASSDPVIDQLTGVVTGQVSATDPDVGDTVTYALASPINPEIGVIDVNPTTGAWTFTPEPDARLDAYLTDIDDDVDFTINATDNKAITPIAVSAPIDPAEAVVTDTVGVGDGPWGAAVSGGYLYVANSSDGTVTVINTATNTVVDTIPVGSDPIGVAVSGDRLYVANGQDGTVTVINTTTNTVVDTNLATPEPDPIIVGDVINSPGIAASGDRLYVAHDNDIVTVFDTTTYTVVGAIPVGTTPSGLAVNGDYLYVNNQADGTVTVVDTITNTVVDAKPATLEIDPITVGSGPIGVAASGARLYVANSGDGTVTVIDTTTQTVVDTITVGNPVGGVAVSGDRVYVSSPLDGTVTVVDTTTNTVVETVAVGAFPAGIAVSGNTIYVANFSDGTVSVITSVHEGPELTPNEDGTFDMELRYGSPGEFEDVVIPEAGQPGAPQYWRVVSQTYDPETGTFVAVLEPTLGAELLAGQNVTLNDSFTLQATPASDTQTQFATFSLRAGSAMMAALDDPGGGTPLPQPPGANLEVVEDAIEVGGKPTGVVVTEKYAYIMNFEEDGSVAVIGADPDDTATYNKVITTIDTGSAPVVGTVAGHNLYVVNTGVTVASYQNPEQAPPSTVTVIDTRDNTVVVEAITMEPWSYSPTASHDGNRVYVSNLMDGHVYVIDSDPKSLTYNQVIDEIVVSPPTDFNTGDMNQLAMGQFNSDGTRLYVMHANGAPGAQVPEISVVVIDTDPTSGTYHTVLDADTTTPAVDFIPIDGFAPGLAATNGTRYYAPTWDPSFVQNPGQLPASTVTVIDIDPNSPTFNTIVDGDTSTPEIDGIPAGTAALNAAVSPDGSVLYVVNSADGTVTVIDTVTNNVITTFTYNSGAGNAFDTNLLGVSPDGKQMYISKNGSGTVTSVRIV